jgi:hypothetical protein
MSRIRSNSRISPSSHGRPYANVATAMNDEALRDELNGLSEFLFNKEFAYIATYG